MKGNTNMKNLEDRFNEAKKKFPNLTYDQIYKEMKVPADAVDPDDYREAEDKWLTEHGF